MKKLISTVVASAFVVALGSVHAAEGNTNVTEEPIVHSVTVVHGAEGTNKTAVTHSTAPSRRNQFLIMGTNTVHYEIVGKGKHDIVLVHCWAGNLTFWDEQVPALADKARLILIDLPGHGKSTKPHVAYTMDFFADSVIAVMENARSTNATLIGHSMGVPVIATVYKKAPKTVAALVALDGTLRKIKVPAEVRERLVGNIRSENYMEGTRQFIGTMFSPGKEAVKERVVSEMLATPQYVMVSAMEGMFNDDAPDWDPKHVDVPVIQINAPNPMWTEDYMNYVKGLSTKWTYNTMNDVGHWLMLEKPAEFNKILTDLLTKYGLLDK